jgi:hypothetical protein
MKRSDRRNYIKNGRVLVSPKSYAIVKTSRACTDALAVIKDSRETTCVVEESKLRAQKFLGIEGGWRMITFDMVLPFSLVGFFALVAGVLAEAGISIFSISAYSTDHVLVKDHDLEKAVRTLEKLGMSVRRL